MFLWCCRRDLIGTMLKFLCGAVALLFSIDIRNKAEVSKLSFNSGLFHLWGSKLLLPVLLRLQSVCVFGNFSSSFREFLESWVSLKNIFSSYHVFTGAGATSWGSEAENLSSKAPFNLRVWHPCWTRTRVSKGLMRITYEKVWMLWNARVKMYHTSGLSKIQVLVLCILAIGQDQNWVRPFYCYQVILQQAAPQLV